MVVELGPGPGALTRVLHKRYPKMLAVEIDGRAVAMLKAAMPDLTVVQSDVLQVSQWHGRVPHERLAGGPRADVHMGCVSRWIGLACLSSAAAVCR